GLRAALKKNTHLQMVATTPLMLQVLMLTYHGTSIRALSQKEAQLREQIWTDYIQKMVERKGDARRYPLHATATRLKWLASQMKSRNQATLYLEQFQLDWLPKRQRSLYQWSVALLFGLASILLLGFAGVLMNALFVGLSEGLVVGLFVGFLGLAIKIE